MAHNMTLIIPSSDMARFTGNGGPKQPDLSHPPPGADGAKDNLSGRRIRGAGIYTWARRWQAQRAGSRRSSLYPTECDPDRCRTVQIFGSALAYGR